MRHKSNHTMSLISIRFILVVLCTIWAQLALAQTRYNVSSQAEFDNAHDQANPHDTIVWVSGTYADIFMDITVDGLTIWPSTNGSVIFNGASKVEIHSDDILFSGFQYVGGDIGDDHVIRIWGSNVLITQINIQDYTSYKYLIIDEDSRRTTVSYSNFENRLNLDDQNILSILVDDEPGYHKVQYCSFKNFEGTGNDLGIEPVRIGVSTQAHLNSRSTVEYCYFTNCDGDGEMISNKAAQNVIRYNTFVDNSKAELVLRHGDDAIVYGNFFINNMGGVRVREGSGHYIYNNYFEGLDRRAIYLQNDPSDPLSDIHIYHNTIINSQEFILGGDGSNPPLNVTIANNIFSDPQDDLFEDATGNETWISNMYFGSLGISQTEGLVNADPLLAVNDMGYYQLDTESPATNAAEGGYPDIPLFEGMDYDSELALDLMKQMRPTVITSRTIGASEPSAIRVHPHATEENTGPDYFRESEVITSVSDVVRASVIYPNPGNDRLKIELPGSNVDRIKCRVVGLDGSILLEKDSIHTNEFELDISRLSSGNYILELTNYNSAGNVLYQEHHSFIKSNR
ncbi:MAG: chondroitinase-B domain-containing protein [Cyclobacteriaceae bacterium]